ncbi:MAG TPA: hypothetical protein VGB37_15605 [Candidatus Lokiarchaeia archaeon]
MVEKGGEKVKICNKCGMVKNENEFPKSKQNKNGLYSYCKECNRLKYKIYYNNNKIKIIKRTSLYAKTHPEINKKAGKKWLQKNRDLKNKKTRDWYLKNKEKKIKTTMLWIKKKRNTDVIYRIIDNQRNRLNMVLKNNHEHFSFLELVGCTKLQFKKHIESLFKNGMNWNNHNLKGWHLDHIKSVSSFKLGKIKNKNGLNKKIKECFHYTNLQPLWANENLKKGVA